LGICGPHSSGKTTLLDALKDTIEFETVDFLPEITRTIKEQGYDINEVGTLDTQVLIMAAHMQNLLTHKRFIVDRCLIDGLCYTRFLYANPGDRSSKYTRIQDWFMDYCEALVEKYLAYYTRIFYIPPELPMVNDGVRSTDSHFHDEIVHLFEETVKRFSNMYPGLIVPVRGSVEQRVQIVLEEIRKIENR
jgi:predicted ATPase